MRPDYDYLFKVVIKGGAKVGKSSLLNKFADNPDNIKKTVVEKNLQLNSKEVKLNVYDDTPL